MPIPDPPVIARPADGYLGSRWIFLRAVGLIFFSAFYSFAFQIHGLIGSHGILPVGEFLQRAAAALSVPVRLWYVPTLFWLGSSDRMLAIVVGAGIVSSLLLVANVWPKLTVSLSTLLFLSIISVLQDFSSYQSDGMLLEAGLISIFFAPRGVPPRLR